LPFDRFLILYIDNDRNAILKDIHHIEYEGNKRVVICVPCKDPLQQIQAANNILAQYFDSAGGSDNMPYILQCIQIAKLESRIERIKAISKSLHQNLDEGLANSLRQLGVPDYKTAEVSVKRFETQLEKLRTDLYKPKKGSQPTYEMFDKILAEIDPKLTAEEITTERFCTLYSKLKTKAKTLEKSHGRGQD
jgi:hypothetical protein